MEISDVINLFKKANRKHDWGDSSYILLYDDGSGEIVSEDSDFMDSEGILEFNTLDELVNKLNKKLKG
jgi:hypothetical protein